MRRSFLAAAALVVAVCGAGGPAPVEVPFRYEAGSITLDGWIDGGRKLRVLLDTGWGPTTLDLRLARELGWLSAEEGPEVVWMRRLSELRIGSIAVHDWEVDVADLSGINPRGEQYDAVLGCSFLRGRIFTIDFAKRVLRFLPAPPRGTAASGVRTTVPIHFGPLGCLPITDSAWVNGRRMNALFDTGAALRFLVTPGAVDRLGLGDSLAGFQAVTSGYFSGDSARSGVAHLGRLRQVRIGSIVADTTRAVFGGRGEGLMDQSLEVWGLLVGTRFLEDYLATFDFRDGRLTLERAPP